MRKVDLGVKIFIIKVSWGLMLGTLVWKCLRQVPIWEKFWWKIFLELTLIGYKKRKWYSQILATELHFSNLF